MSFSVRLDDRAVMALMDRFTEPEVKKILRKGMTKAGAAMKKVVGPAIPRGPTGNLRSSLKAKRIRSNPAIGVVVGPMGRKAAHRHLVAGGTKPHLIRPRPPNTAMHLAFGFATLIEHPGARPNPWLDRVDDPAYLQGIDAAETVIDNALT